MWGYMTGCVSWNKCPEIDMDYCDAEEECMWSAALGCLTPEYFDRYGAF